MGELIFFTPFIFFTTDTYVFNWFVAIWDSFVLEWDDWVVRGTMLYKPYEGWTNMLMLLLFLS